MTGQFTTIFIMRFPMVHLSELAEVVAILDGITHPSVVDRALRKADIRREVLKAEAGFVPYSVEAVVLESVARSIGERHLGALVGAAFDYRAYRGYADYVLGAATLAGALARGQRALPLLHPGSYVSLVRDGPNVILGFDTGLQSVVGHRHLDEGAAFVMSVACRHFMGPDWHPEWISVTGDGSSGFSTLEDLTGAPIRGGAARTALAIRMADLATPNPNPPAPADIVTLRDLPALMGAQHPKSMEDVVRETLRLQFRLGGMSEDSVARRLSLGPRSLQRALQQEGTSFREIRARFIQDHARALLSDTALSVEAVGRALGYAEPKSFRRAFRGWTGQSPAAYRTAICEAHAPDPGHRPDAGLAS
ncbi:MAG: helix-turn-helix domain-containing protein [Rhodobacteraceae bacterium]|nr:helix-turn-helix domain-containing protein [Paracoccaceae bacterium]